MIDRNREIKNIWSQLALEDKKSFINNFGKTMSRFRYTIYENDIYKTSENHTIRSSKQEFEAEIALRLLKMWRNASQRDPQEDVRHQLVADRILLWFMLPDDAEDLAGWLYEERSKVAKRHAPRFAKVWFYWALLWVIANHIVAHIGEKTTLGRILCALARRLER